MLRYLMAFSILTLYGLPGGAATPLHRPFPGGAQGKDILDSLPIRFEALGEAGSRYLARSPYYALELTPGEARLWPRASAGPRRPLRIQLRGAHSNPRLEASGALTARGSYLLGRDPSRWLSGVEHYARVTYRQVYPGIDLAFYGSGRNLEYDFIVSPYANPHSIRVRFDGATSLSIEPDGSLLVQAGSAVFRQPKPVVWQPVDSGRSYLSGQYRIHGRNEISFVIEPYDHSRTLVIDPLIYSTYIGGESGDAAFAVAVDSQGLAWVTGTTTSPGFPMAGDVPQGQPVGSSDVFLVRIDPRLEGPDSLVYSTFLGGTGQDQATGIAIDRQGYVTVVGWTSSADFPLVDHIRDTNAGEQDVFVLRIDPNAAGNQQLVYSTYLGGKADDRARSVAVDSAGRIYVAGETNSEDFPLNAPTQTSIRGGYDGFFTVLNPQLGLGQSLEYSSFLGGDGWDVIRAITVDPNGTLFYVAGGTTSSNFPATDNGLLTAYQGRGDAFLAKIDLSKDGLDSLVYATFIGGADFDNATALAWAGPDRCWIAGYTFSEDLRTTASVFQASPAGNGDIFAALFDLTLPQGNELVYSSYLGGSSSDVPYAVAVDAQGRAWLTGYTASRDFPVRGNVAQDAFGGGGSDAFLAVLDPEATGEANLRHSSYFGGSLSDAGYGIALDATGGVHLAGFSISSNLAATENALQSGRNVFADAFLSILQLAAEDLAQ